MTTRLTNERLRALLFAPNDEPPTGPEVRAMACEVLALRAALGRAIDKLEPGTSGRADVMKYLGGKAAPLLGDVGAIGKSILPDQVANSGTAQRLWYQSLLRGSGILGGGTVGGALGGVPGAIMGTAVGDFAIPQAIQLAYLSKPMRGLLTKQKQHKQYGPEEDLLRRYGGLLGYSASLE